MTVFLWQGFDRGVFSGETIAYMALVTWAAVSWILLSTGGIVSEFFFDIYAGQSFRPAGVAIVGIRLLFELIAEKLLAKLDHLLEI